MKLNIIALATLLCVVSSCSSPLDLNTPRNRWIDTLAQTLKPTRILLTMNDGSTDQPYIWRPDLSAVIDTTGGRIHLSLRGGCGTAIGTDGSLPVRELSLALDEVPCDGSDVDIVGGPSDASGGEIVGQLGPGYMLERFEPDGATVTIGVRIEKVPGERRLSGRVSMLFPLLGRPFGVTALLTVEY